MIRGLILSSFLFASAVEGATPEPDLLRYGITQGGLLAVVVVLLYFYRRDFLRDKADARDLSLISRDQMALFQTLVEKSTAALVTAADSTQQLVKAVDALRGPRR